mmetsp:Transcript_111956/g.316451  ORF Transcript_111956/g.316451 Transcript_111956/m.316451 type:complete len:234 (+) Transcript_111956:1363-2064(+)
MPAMRAQQHSVTENRCSGPRAAKFPLSPRQTGCALGSLERRPELRPGFEEVAHVVQRQQPQGDQGGDVRPRDDRRVGPLQELQRKEVSATVETPQAPSVAPRHKAFDCSMVSGIRVPEKPPPTLHRVLKNVCGLCEGVAALQLASPRLEPGNFLDALIRMQPRLDSFDNASCSVQLPRGCGERTWPHGLYRQMRRMLLGAASTTPSGSSTGAASPRRPPLYAGSRRNPTGDGG